MIYSIKEISGGEEFEVYANEDCLGTCPTRGRAEGLIARLDAAGTTLKTVWRDCEMALNGEWDKGDEGFRDTQDLVASTLLLLGEDVPGQKKKRSKKKASKK